MFGTCPGDSPGNDFAPFRDKLPESFGGLVIYFKVIIHTESAYFTALVESAFTAAFLGSTILIHYVSSA
jgi:hypothetical protein